MIKIFKKNNYVFLVDLESGKQYPAHASTAKITRKSSGAETFFFEGFDNLPASFGAYGLELSSIVDQDEEAFADADAFEDWYTANTGKNSAGTGATNPRELISDDVDNAIVVGSDNKFLVQQEKEYILKIGSEDETGFLSTEVSKNTLGVSFAFSRLSAGTFSVAGFDKARHMIEFYAVNGVGFAVWNPDDNVLQLSDLNGVIDYLFIYGGFIKIKERP